MSKLRYEVKVLPEYRQEPKFTHMVVDNKKHVAVKYGTKGECEIDAYARNDGNTVG